MPYDPNTSATPSTHIEPSTGDYITGGLGAASLLFPPLAIPSLLWNLGRGIDQGSSNETYKAPDVLGSQRAGDFLYGGGVSGWLGRQIGSLFADKTDFPSANIPYQISAPLSPVTTTKLPDLSPTERSLDQAYSTRQTYDTGGKGWQLAPGSIAPQPSSNWGGYDQAAHDANIAAAKAIQESLQGGWTPWYEGQADPYDKTGNMLSQPWAGSFGAGRYADSPAFAGTNWGNNSGGFVSNNTEEMFGPMARFVQGNKYDTN